MGSWLSSLFFRKEARVVMIGLDNAGKTTIMYQLKLKEMVKTVPTIGFNLERINIGRTIFEIRDLGGQSKIRTLWRHYYNEIDAVVFVVDLTDFERLPEAQTEFQKVTQNKNLGKTVLLVLGNKMDDTKAIDKRSLENVLNVQNVKQKVEVRLVSARFNKGIYPAFEWLSQNL
ncbi:ADP-ribosylation factor, putative [Entamoeba invadens IP1]|uniref:ADP-ribosylation factor, putative n=1 Tax=Entamoeba invadens IP1 TaxID=370355 RepID=A0A0A1U5I4_ENTIV|nr:ADP-ribosylation factor, putative [Entamoeba invadens IP1]ELP87031.1 ADP-ribosylation factor, putative [Entamoeba invadens IP1]|eukprot:XP_004253802.1 ADP-ribosylation factor, putative [Entamoeba invadens IP1]